MLITLIIALATYIGMVFFVRHRTVIAILGGSILLIYGTLSKAFSAHQAFQKFPKEIVILIVVLALFAKVFERKGFFNYIGDRFVQITKGKRIVIAVLLPIVMYVTSLFMNNLSVILLFTFICLELALNFDLPIIPLLVSGIIASNIGGAPLPWADTPAVILTLYTDFNLIDFITKLFLPCAIYAALLAGYTIIWFKYLENKNHIIRPHSFREPEHPENHKEHKYPKGSECPKRADDSSLREIKVSIVLFILFITSVCIAPFIDLSIAFVSMFFGSILLIINKDNPEDIINAIPILDSLIFITALFLIGGALEYSGILNTAVEYILTFTGENNILIVLYIMGSAFLIATFLSAGPAAATLLPICAQFSPLIGNKLVYAALALGILAGSSMLPWSATGGPVMLGEVKRFLKQSSIRKEDKERIMEIFNLKGYLAFSIPFSLIILILSGLFLTFYVIAL